MSKSLTIGQLAKATSVTAQTIRYYEQVGVLPPARRTSSGYRTYDERSVERLLFIRRARALGLPLRRLEPLWTALNGGPRTAFRPRLRALVREHLSAVHRQLGDLGLLERQLRRVMTRLSTSRRPTTDGRCRCLDVAR